MSDVVITRYGEWFVVSVENAVYNHATGGHDTVSTPYGSFRDQHDAYDLLDVLRRVARGDLKPEVWIDGPGSDD